MSPCRNPTMRMHPRGSLRRAMRRQRRAACLAASPRGRARPTPTRRSSRRWKGRHPIPLSAGEPKRTRRPSSTTARSRRTTEKTRPAIPTRGPSPPGHACSRLPAWRGSQFVWGPGLTGHRRRTPGRGAPRRDAAWRLAVDAASALLLQPLRDGVQGRARGNSPQGVGVGHARVLARFEQRANERQAPQPQPEEGARPTRAARYGGHPGSPPTLLRPAIFLSVTPRSDHGTFETPGLP